MKALGIVSEYNPFHNGHKYHLNRSLELSGADILIVVMSGNFTERGEAAIENKYERSKIACENGANLVLELPLIYATQNAGDFARGGIGILEGMGCDFISFGVEDPNEILDLSRFISSNGILIEEEIKTYVKEGLSYPKARENVIINKLGDKYSEILKKPNNILAIEYLNNMKESKPIFVKRNFVGHNEEYNKTYASGSYIRKLISQNSDYSQFIPYDYTFKNTNFDQMLFEELRTIILKEDELYLNSIYGAEEGLGDILKKNVRYYNSYSDVIASLKSKRYTETRVRRVILNTILGIRKEDILNLPLYGRVLAFDEKGKAYLNELKKTDNKFPIITNINKVKDEGIKKSLKYDILGNDLYNKFTGNDLYLNSDFVKVPSRF